MNLNLKVFAFYFIIISAIFAFFTNYFLGQKLQTSAKEVSNELQSKLDKLARDIPQYIYNDNYDSFNGTLDENLAKQNFANIDLISKDNKVLFSKSIQNLKPLYIESWILNKIGIINQEVLRANVKYGGKEIAKLMATINTSYVHKLAWKNSIDALYFIFYSYISIIALSILFLHWFFAPLRRINDQVKNIANQDYQIENKLPQACDLRDINECLNQTSIKIRELFIEHNQLSDLIRENAYKERITNLANKSYFLLQLNKMLSSSEVGIGGAILVLEIDYRHISNEHLASIATILKKYAKSDKKVFVLSYFENRQFGLIIKNVSRSRIENVCQNILNTFMMEGSVNKTNNSYSINLGATVYKLNTFAKDLVLQAENALADAKQKVGNSYKVYKQREEEPEGFNYSQWRNHLQGVLESKDIILQFQPVYFYENNGTLLFHSEVFIRIRGINKELLFSGSFLPVVFSEKLGVEYDKLIIEGVLDRINDNVEGMQRYGVNLSYQSLTSEEFFLWLDLKLKTFGENSRKLNFEFMEPVVKGNPDLFKKFINISSKYGVQVGIDHFGCGFSNFDYLEDTKIAYIKIDGSYTKDLHKNTENQAIIKSFVELAHSRDILVFATCVEIAEERETLNKLNIDGIQGYLIGQPV